MGKKTMNGMANSCEHRVHGGVASPLLDGLSDVIINIADLHGETPLHIVSNRGNVDICGLLINRGADLDAKTRMEEHRCISLALGGANQDTRSEHGKTKPSSHLEEKSIFESR